MAFAARQAAYAVMALAAQQAAHAVVMVVAQQSLPYVVVVIVVRQVPYVVLLVAAELRTSAEEETEALQEGDMEKRMSKSNAIHCKHLPLCQVGAKLLVWLIVGNYRKNAEQRVYALQRRHIAKTQPRRTHTVKFVLEITATELLPCGIPVEFRKYRTMVRAGAGGVPITNNMPQPHRYN